MISKYRLFFQINVRCLPLAQYISWYMFMKKIFSHGSFLQNHKIFDFVYVFILAYCKNKTKFQPRWRRWATQLPHNLMHLKCGKFASEKNVENNLRAKKMWKMYDFDELYPFGFGENLIFQNEWTKNVKSWEKTGNSGIFSKLKKRSLQVFFCFNSYNLKMKRPMFLFIVCQMEMSILESLLNEIKVHLNIGLWTKKKNVENFEICKNEKSSKKKTYTDFENRGGNWKWIFSCRNVQF